MAICMSEDVSFRTRGGLGLPSHHQFAQARSFGSDPINNESGDSRATGAAWFELCDNAGHTARDVIGGGRPPNVIPPPFASISSAFGFRNRETLFFGRVAPPQRSLPARSSQASKKVEYYSLKRVAGDGRCMFRALVLGMAANKGMRLNDSEEENEADQLRIAVYDAICTSEKRRRVYEEALIAITLDESLKKYCERIQRPSFWGGEAELLVLSRMCATPIVVYIPENQARQGGKWGTGFISIAEYGSEYGKGSKDRKSRKPVRLLFNGVNHYDLLL